MKQKTIILFPLCALLIITVHFVQLYIISSDNKELHNSKKNLSQFTNVGVIQSNKLSADELNENDINEMVYKAIDNAGGMAGAIKPGSKVIIKVNLVDTKIYGSNGIQYLDKQVNGVTVDWRVAKAVAKKLKSFGAADIYIIEGSLQPTLGVFKYMNYDKIIEVPEKNLIALENDLKTNNELDFNKLKRVEVKDGLIKRVYYINKRILEADAVISVAALKTHRRIAMTGAVKNVGIGLYPSLLKPNSLLANSFPNDRGDIIDHRPIPLSKWITDYFSLIPVKFAVIDALQGAQNGPLPSEPKDRQLNLRTIIAGADSVAVDTVGNLIMGRDPKSALYLKMLEDRGVGITNTSNIIVKGSKVAEIRKVFQSLYGNPIPDKRQLKINMSDSIKKENGTEIVFEVNSSHGLAHLELVADGNVEKIFDKTTRKILIDKSLYNKQLYIRAYNIYFDESEVKVVIEK